MAEIKRGDAVLARPVSGDPLRKRAMGGETMGKAFAVVWVCREDEWELATREGREPEGVPWPAEDVEPLRSRART